ncbi:MAG: hypothetical protein J6A79_11380 [Clostridia bacterium]|nr:hypothetical protein [Clostridia bacterium]
MLAMDQIHDIRNDYDVQALNSTKPVPTGFENGILVNIILLWLTVVSEGRERRSAVSALRVCRAHKKMLRKT